MSLDLVRKQAKEKTASELSPASRVRLHTSDGLGSTNNKIRKFSTLVEEVGTDISFNGLTASATNGAEFTINADGIYSISYCDLWNVASVHDISLNSNQLTTALSSITVTDRLISTNPTVTDQVMAVTWTGFLAQGDVIRPHTHGDADGASINRAAFTVTQIIKLG